MFSLTAACIDAMSGKALPEPGLASLTVAWWIAFSELSSFFFFFSKELKTNCCALWCHRVCLCSNDFPFHTSVGSGSTSSSGLTGGYIPSFLKKEIGSVMQRVHLAPLADPSPGELHLQTSVMSSSSYLTAALCRNSVDGRSQAVVSARL